MATRLVSLVVASIFGLSVGSSCEGTALTSTNELCTSINDISECPKTYFVLGGGSGGQCGWRDGQCLTTSFCEDQVLCDLAYTAKASNEYKPAVDDCGGGERCGRCVKKLNDQCCGAVVKYSSKDMAVRFPGMTYANCYWHTHWMATTFGQTKNEWVVFELESPQAVTKFMIYPQNEYLGTSSRDAKDIRILHSPDGETYTLEKSVTLKQSTEEKMDDIPAEDVPIDTGNAFKFWKIEILSNYGSPDSVGFTEVRIMGTHCGAAG